MTKVLQGNSDIGAMANRNQVAFRELSMLQNTLNPMLARVILANQLCDRAGPDHAMLGGVHREWTSNSTD